ncbi:hypothetical protein RF11_16202 [Thelohanellus kitauei]|uniref:Uncharacterized protein n=1 Tax=Thelohanellus kitauei TaxID=669202 RepID=A0A0C2NKT2_THEKT|nr:hypothetical protein RF11_16202 [Thelohanellus kitauei]
MRYPFQIFSKLGKCRGLYSTFRNVTFKVTHIKICNSQIFKRFLQSLTEILDTDEEFTTQNRMDNVRFHHANLEILIPTHITYTSSRDTVPSLTHMNKFSLR